MDLTATARKMAAAFTSGESQDSLAAALEELLPWACFVSLCLCGSDTIAVPTSNLMARGTFMTQSLLSIERLRCLMTGRPCLAPAGRAATFLPVDQRSAASEFLCIPIPKIPAAAPPDGEPISGLVEEPGGSIGTLIVGLKVHHDRPEDPGLVSTVANLVRALAAQLPGAATGAARDIVRYVLPVRVGQTEEAAAAEASAAAVAPSQLSTVPEEGYGSEETVTASEVDAASASGSENSQQSDWGDSSWQYPIDGCGGLCCAAPHGSGPSSPDASSPRSSENGSGRDAVPAPQNQPVLPDEHSGSEQLADELRQLSTG